MMQVIGYRTAHGRVRARIGVSVLGAMVLTASGGTARAASPAASACPAGYFLSGQLAQHPGFEAAGPNGPSTCWENGDPFPAPSAAAGWFMHSSNAGARVCSRLVTSTAPGPNGQRMLRFTAGGNEGGVYQTVPLTRGKGYMFSVWVFVHRGQVAIQSAAFTGGPVAWSTKVGEWEQLRVCNNSEFGADMLVVYNQDPKGGMFDVDRAELKEIAVLE